MLSLITPVYNEEQNVEPFLNSVVPIISNVSNNDYEIIFCMDPGTDNTEKKILEKIDINKKLKLLKFSRRFGQSNSIFAGIENCNGDYCIIMDIDLQDPPEIIEKLFSKIKQGYDCVYAKRKKKIGESFFRNFLTKIYYFTLNYFSYVKIPKNAGECRIISRKIVEKIKLSKEYHCYIRGITPILGFKHAAIEFVRMPRKVGKSKYVIGSYKDAISGVINFTNLLPNLCLIVFALNILLNLFMLIMNALTITIIYFSVIFSIILFFLYFIFHYLIQINNMSMNRKPYIIDEKINF